MASVFILEQDCPSSKKVIGAYDSAQQAKDLNPRLAKLIWKPEPGFSNVEVAREPARACRYYITEYALPS